MLEREPIMLECRTGNTRGFLIVVTLLPILLLSGCRKTEPQTIRVVGDEWFLSTLEKAGVVSAFEKRTGAHVKLIYENDREIMKHLDQNLKAGDPSYDVVVMRHQLMGSLIQKNQIQPIDSLMNDHNVPDPGFNPQQQLFPNWWKELSSYADHIYGFPYTGLTVFTCYRKDLLEDPETRRRFKSKYHREIAPPTSWAEYTELAEFFNRPSDKFYGTYISGKQGQALRYEWLNLVYSFGGNVLDASRGSGYGDIVVNSPQNVAATLQYKKLVAFSPPDTLNYGWNEAQSALQQGHVFMGLLWSDQAHFLEDSAVSKVAGKIGYSLVPSASAKPASQMEGLTYLIPAESRDPKDAYRFMEWALSNQMQIQQALKGSGSLRISAYGDPAVKAIPYTSTFLASVPIAIAKPTIPEASKIADATAQRISDILTGKDSPQTGLDKLALDIQKLLGGKAKLRYPVLGTS
jgi:multiple sugar transport system substrate-binding protein